MNFASLCRIVGLSLALLLPATFAHANFFGTPGSYPHATTPLVSVFRDGYYVIDRGKNGSSTVLVTKRKDGMYMVESSLGSSTFGFHDNGGNTYVAFGRSEKGYGYFIVTAKDGAVTVYDTSLAARKLLKRRVKVNRMPFDGQKSNKEFLHNLLKFRSDFRPLYTAIPIKTPK